MLMLKNTTTYSQLAHHNHLPATKLTNHTHVWYVCSRGMPAAVAAQHAHTLTQWALHMLKCRLTLPP